MERIALITDSTSDINQASVEKYKINMLPLRIIYRDREYIDRVNITPTEVYQNLKHEIPKTSLPSMQDIDDLFVSLKEKGYTHVIAITISSGLSGTYNSMKLVAENHPEIKTFVYDSKSLSLGEGALVLECAELIEKGMKFDDIIAELPNIRKRGSLYYIVDTLEYLIKGGRIGKVSGVIGNLLNIKPIISISEEDGVYFTHSKVRGSKQAFNKLSSLCADIISEKSCKVFVMHTNALEAANKMCELLKTSPNVKSISVGELCPVAGVHCGPGLVGVVVLKDK